jgi:hypothetical protein
MSETASTTMTTSPLGGGVFQYTITLTNTSAASTIGTFWFAWDDQPDTNFLITQPTGITAPAGWTDKITHNTASDGFGIQWVASAATNDLQAGGHFQFSFESTDPPAQIFRPNTVGDINPGTSQLFDITSSFVYAAGPETDAGFNLVVPCFGTGTHILTAAGEKPVEHLLPGDLVPVRTRRGLLPVRWVGQRRVDCRRHADPAMVWPVRVHADAFGRGRPARDLRLSPDHALCADGALIPIRHLINGVTILQEPVAEVTYWHVELAGHDILVVERLLAESYLDTGNRDLLSGVIPARAAAKS